jgi:hypothetical protein
VNQPGTFGDVAVLAGGKVIQDYIDELRSAKQVPGESVQHGRETAHRCADYDTAERVFRIQPGDSQP